MNQTELVTLYNECVHTNTTGQSADTAENAAVQALCKALETVNAPMYSIFRTYCEENEEDVITALSTFWAENNPEKTLLTAEITLAACKDYSLQLAGFRYKTIVIVDRYIAALYNGLTLFSGIQLPTDLLTPANIGVSEYQQYWDDIESQYNSSEAWSVFTDALTPVIANAVPPKSNIGVLCEFKVQDQTTTGVLTAVVKDGKILFTRMCTNNVRRFLTQCPTLRTAKKAFTDVTGRCVTATYRALKDYTAPLLNSTVIQVEAEQENIFASVVAADGQTVTYMPKFQACRCAGIFLEIVDVINKNGELKPKISVTKNADKALKSIYKYYVYLLHSNADADVIAMFSGDTDAVQRVIDKLSKSILLNYAVTTADGCDIGVTAYIHSRTKAALFGTFLANTTDTGDTNAQRYFRTSADRILCSPDSWQAGKLTFTLHSDKVLYFTQTDFGYKANHRRYEHAPLKLSATGNGGPLLGRTIAGEDFCPGDWLSNAYIGLAIFAGSRSGKGVLTNNIISTLLASGCGVIYIDSKPEQARAIWGFERYYNAHTTGTPLKLLAVDWNAPVAEYGDTDFAALIAKRKQEEIAALDKTAATYNDDVDAIERRYAKNDNSSEDIPMHGCTYATANIPAFFSEKWFIEYCKRVGASKVCSPEFFNALRVLKLLHLIVSDGLIRAGIPNNPDVGPLYGGRVDLNRYGYVIWDELQKTTGTYGPILAQLYPLVKALNTDVAKKRKNNNDAPDEPTLTQLETAQKYITRIHEQYNIYNATGTGTETGAVKSELINGFSDFNTFAKTSNIKFIFISQNAPQKINIPYPVGLYTLFKSCGLLVGRNGYIGATNEFAYDTSIDCAPLVNGNVSAVCPSAGDVSVSGYFTYRSNGDPTSAKVFKSFLTLLENDIAPTVCPENVKEIADFTQDTRRQFIDTTGGCCGLGDGSGVVINTIGRIPADAREAVIKNDCYKPDGTRNEELGFIGSTYALMQMAMRNNGVSADALTDSINKFYEELLYVVNANLKMAGVAQTDKYASIEEFIGDMSYESLLSYATYRLNPPQDTLENVTVDCNTGTAIHGIGEEFVFEDAAENSMSSVENADADDDIAVDVLPDDSENVMKPSEYDDNDVFVADDTADTESDNYDDILSTTHTSDDKSDDKSDDNMHERYSNTPVNVALKRKSSKTNDAAFSQQPVLQRAVQPKPTSEELYDAVDEYTRAAFQQAARHGITDKLASRRQLTEFLRRCIKSFVSDDYTLITSVKIDDVGHLYINDTLIRPNVQELGQSIPPAMKTRMDNGQWGDLFCANSLFAYRNIQKLDIASNRVTTVAYELGVREIGDILQPRYRQANFPYLTELYISGSPYVPQTAKATTLADKLSAIIDSSNPKNTQGISNAATALWQNCRPLRFATKVFGYSLGLKVAWAGAALFGPIGLAIAGLGTAALAFTEYDSFKQSRVSPDVNVNARAGRAQGKPYVDTTFTPVDESVSKPQTASKQNSKRQTRNRT